MDDDRVGQLLDAAAARLAAYGYLLTGSQRAGEDLLQDAIVKAFVRHRRLTNVGAAEGQVRAAMRTIHLSNVRRATTWRAALPTIGSRPAARTDNPGEPPPLDLMGRAMSSLSPQERAVVVLRHCDQLQVPEIAVAMRTSESAVERHLAEAHAMLARTLGEIEPEFDQVLIVDRTRR